jgi:hypothetical protein
MLQTFATEPYPEAWPLNAATRQFLVEDPNAQHPTTSTANAGSPSDLRPSFRLIPSEPVTPVGQQATNSVDKGVQGDVEPRRSQRDKKVPDPNPPPTSTFERRGKKNRKRDRGSGDSPGAGAGGGDSSDAGGTPKGKMAVVTIKIQEVHRQALSRQNILIAETAVKMEAVEVRHPPSSGEPDTQ